MSEPAAPIHLRAESVEGRRIVELVRDEDVLSLELQHALEQVGSGVGFIAALALLFSQLPRAGRLIGLMRGTPASAPPTGTPS